MDLIQFLIATLLAGVATFGGGRAFIPTFQNLYVDTFSILSNLELQEIIVIASTMPGPFAPLVVGPLGYKLFGWLGFISSLLALTSLPLFIFIILSNLIRKKSDNKNIQRIAKYMSPAIIALLLSVCIKNFPASTNHDFKYILYYSSIFTISSILLLKYKIHPAILIFLTGTLGIFILN